LRRLRLAARQIVTTLITNATMVAAARACSRRRGSLGGRTAPYSPRRTNVTVGASQSLAEKPCSPSSLSSGMFADLRSRKTAPCGVPLFDRAWF